MGWFGVGKRTALAAMILLAAASGAGGEVPANLKVAFLGDGGARKDKAGEVLALVKAEGAEAVLHQGDFDYQHDPAGWDAMVTDILGADFPYFASVGNHDEREWEGYQKVLEARMQRVGVSWEGQFGVQSSLTYKGLRILLVGPDSFGENHDSYIRDQLAGETAIWRICSWHKNMRDMQVGGKSDETGWGVYEESRKAGAIIATGHEHSYSRTHLLSDMENKVIASRSDTLRIDEGKTFAFVSGISGKSMRRLRRLPLGEWWAKVYTTDNGSNHGALFATFNVNGRPDVAEFYFKDIDGKVVDRFTVISEVGKP